MLDLVFSAEGGSASGGKNNTLNKHLGEKFFRDVLDMGIRELKIKDKNIEVSINLVGEARIKELNKKYRNKNEVTDVLSFPLLEWAPSPAKRGDKGTLLDETGLQKHAILPLGDIFICLPFAVKETKRRNISLKKEMAWLTVHGFLHLLGYDHEKSEASARKMLKLEDKILSKL